MEGDLLNLSAEAALELQELKEGVRADAPALGQLFSRLKAPAPAFEKGESDICMLADVRSYTLFKNSLSQAQPHLKSSDFHEFMTVLANFIDELEAGVSSGHKGKIEQAKVFCQALNENWIARRMNEILSRRERSDSRYMSHESAS